jgi:hypothetical protein
MPTRQSNICRRFSATSKWWPLAVTLTADTKLSSCATTATLAWATRQKQRSASTKIELIIHEVSVKAVTQVYIRKWFMSQMLILIRYDRLSINPLAAPRPPPTNSTKSSTSKTIQKKSAKTIRWWIWKGNWWLVFRISKRKFELYQQNHISKS